MTLATRRAVFAGGPAVGVRQATNPAVSSPAGRSSPARASRSRHAGRSARSRTAPCRQTTSSGSAGVVQPSGERRPPCPGASRTEQFKDRPAAEQVQVGGTRMVGVEEFVPTDTAADPLIRQSSQAEVIVRRPLFGCSPATAMPGRTTIDRPTNPAAGSNSQAGDSDRATARRMIEGQTGDGDREPGISGPGADDAPSGPRRRGGRPAARSSQRAAPASGLRR